MQQLCPLWEMEGVVLQAVRWAVLHPAHAPLLLMHLPTKAHTSSAAAGASQL
jgi:hypothetical protein